MPKTVFTLHYYAIKKLKVNYLKSDGSYMFNTIVPVC